jgi:hypothetical protein
MDVCVREREKEGRVDHESSRVSLQSDHQLS